MRYDAPLEIFHREVASVKTYTPCTYAMAVYLYILYKIDSHQSASTARQSCCPIPGAVRKINT